MDGTRASFGCPAVENADSIGPPPPIRTERAVAAGGERGAGCFIRVADLSTASGAGMGRDGARRRFAPIGSIPGGFPSPPGRSKATRPRSGALSDSGRAAKFANRRIRPSDGLPRRRAAKGTPAGFRPAECPLCRGDFPFRVLAARLFKIRPGPDQGRIRVAKAARPAPGSTSPARPGAPRRNFGDIARRRRGNGFPTESRERVCRRRGPGCWAAAFAFKRLSCRRPGMVRPVRRLESESPDPCFRVCHATGGT